MHVFPGGDVPDGTSIRRVLHCVNQLEILPGSSLKMCRFHPVYEFGALQVPGRKVSRISGRFLQARNMSAAICERARA